MKIILNIIIFCLLVINLTGLSGCKSPNKELPKKEPFTAKLIILNDGKLELCDGNAKVLRKVNSSQPVHDFLWVDDSTLFFTAKNDRNLIVQMYNPQEDSVYLISEIQSQSENTLYWEIDEYHDMFVKDGKLYIECDFYSEMPLFLMARKVTEVDLKTGQYITLSREMVETSASELTPKLEDIFGGSKLKGKFEVTSDTELLYTDGAGKRTKVTSTPIAKESVETGGGLGYQVMPDSERLLFYVVQSVGDYIHGPVYAVNVDGSQQVKLSDDIFYFDAFVIYPDGDVYFTDGDVLSKLNKGNSPEILRRDISKVRSFSKFLPVRMTR